MARTKTYVGKVIVGTTKLTIDTPSKAAVRAFFTDKLYEECRRILTLYDKYDLAIAEHRDQDVLDYLELA